MNKILYSFNEYFLLSSAGQTYTNACTHTYVRTLELLVKTEVVLTGIMSNCVQRACAALILTNEDVDSSPNSL